ncbi:MAG: YitT family protein [Ruminococcus sp.]|nr:YitT family protein [Ruminococcus sp.]
MREKKEIKNFLTDTAYDVVGSILYAIAVYTFAKEADFAPGGISGLALLANHLWDFPIGMATLIMNVPLIILSYKLVGKRFLIKTAKTMVISTIFVDWVLPMFPVYKGDYFLAAIFYGIFIAAGMALFYMRGSSSGGTDFLIMSIKALKPHLSIGGVTMVIDLIVIGLGALVFKNVDAVLYGLAATFLSSFVLDKILYGAGAGTLLIIITTKADDVARRISDIIGRGSTAIRARGTYTGNEREVLLCACTKAQSYMVQRAVYEIDEKAFVMMTETSQVFGEGFIEQEKKV